jgi:RHS repeat-associated protein
MHQDSAGRSALRWITASLASASLLWMQPTHAEVSATGAFVTSIPIQVPAFHSIAPGLSLRYNSQAGNGPVGVGWNLEGLSEIHATSVTGGVATGGASDQYWLDGNQLIPCQSGSTQVASPSCQYATGGSVRAYASRTETFRRIAFDPSAGGGRWYVWDKDGTKVTYSPARDLAQWNISDVVDTDGNTVHYSYSNVTFGTSPDYLDTITYNQTTIRIYWEPRSDSITFPARGWVTTMAQRVKSIDVQVEGKRQRVYSLSYHYSGGTQRSILANVLRYGSLATVLADGTVNGLALPPVSVVYNENPVQAWVSDFAPAVQLPNITFPVLPNQYSNHPEAVNTGASQQFLSGDFDGDGRSDALLLAVLEDPSVAAQGSNIWGPQSVSLQTHVRLAAQKWVDGNMTFTAPAHWGDPILADGRGEIVHAWVADVNGDGLDDLILMSWTVDGPADMNGILHLQLNAALSNGDGTFRLAQPSFVPTPWQTAHWAGGPGYVYVPDTPECTPGDFNGDGRADFACMFQDSLSKQFLGVSYSTDDTSFVFGATIQIADDPGTVVPPSGIVAVARAFPFETRRVAAGDINNDGQTDLIILDLNPGDVSTCAALGDPSVQRVNCSIKYDLLTLLSRGGPSDGFDQTRTPTTWVREDFAFEQPGSLLAGDLNGDGRADVMFLSGTLRSARYQTIHSIRTAISRSDGSYNMTDSSLSADLSSRDVAIALADTNGDNRLDLMIATPVAPGDGVSCSNASFTRAVLTVVRADANGAFSLPARWDDCSSSTEVTDSWAQWVGATGVAPMLAADTNGDEYADFLLPTIPSSNSSQWQFVPYDHITQPDSTTTRHWVATDLNGDGQTDFIAIISRLNDSGWLVGSALTLIAQPDGSFKSAQADLGSFDNQSQNTWKIADFDGDGRADVVHVQCLDTTVHGACQLVAESYFSKGDGTFQPGAFSLPLPAAAAKAAPLATLRAGDVNGDGKADLFQPITLNLSSGPGLGIRTLISDGSSWTQMPLSALDLGKVPTYLFDNALGWKVGDFTGDGRVDLAHIDSDSSSALMTLVTLGDSGWTAVTKPVDFTPVPSGWPAYKGRADMTRWRVADINGDGIADLVRFIPSDTAFVAQTLFSLGTGDWYAAANQVSLPAAGTAARYFGSRDFDIVDVNGDGHEDMVYLEPAGSHQVAATIFESKGLAFSDGSSQPVPTDQSGFLPRPTRQIVEVGAGGQASIAYVDDAGGASVVVRTMGLAQSNDLLADVNTSGAITNISYSLAGSFIDSSSTGPCGFPLGALRFVVAQTGVSDGLSPAADTVSYGYNCPIWSYYLRGQVGWQSVRATAAAQPNRPQTIVESRYDNSDTCGARPQDQNIRNAAGTFVGSRRLVSYQPMGTSAPFQCLVSYEQEIAYGNKSPAPGVNLRTSFEYDTLGNVTSEVQDDLAGNARLTAWTFHHSGQPYLMGLPRSRKIYGGATSSAALLRSSVFCYDGDISAPCDVTPLKGHLTSHKELWEQGTRITSFSYDGFGNVSRMRDGNGHETSYQFDPVQHSFPTEITNALHQALSRVTWDRTLGVVKQLTGLNGETTTHDYDEFGRTLKTTSPSGMVLTRSYDNWGIARLQHVTETIDDGSPDGLWTRQFLDGLGRLYRIERKSDLSTDVLGQLITYSDSSNRPYQVSRSARWLNGSGFPPGPTTSYYYDASAEVTKLVNPDGSAVQISSSTAGNHLVKTILNEVDESSQVTSDAFGRVLEVRAFDANRPIRTEYAYDGVDEILQITDPNRNVITSKWDMLGRKMQVSDPDLGSRTYTYDLVDNVMSVTDARHQTTAFRYDAINRISQEEFPNHATVRWFYDSAKVSNGLGRLTSYIDLTAGKCGSDPSAIIDYNPSGQAISLQRCIEGVHAQFGFQYDKLGRQTQVTYPNGEQVQYEYDRSGTLAALAGLAKVTQRNASGAPEDIQLSNGVLRSRSYDPNRGWLTSASDTLGNQVVFDTEYGYRRNSELATDSSSSNQTQLSFSYDTLGRLKQMSGADQQSWNYDDSGNIKYNSLVGAYRYPPQGVTGCASAGGRRPCSQPHGALDAGPYRLTYDANGLVTRTLDTAHKTSRTITWTFDGHPSSVTDFTGAKTTYEYDAFGNRVLEKQGANTTIYFGNLSRQSAVGTAENIYWLGHLPIGSRSAGVRTWWHTDRSGSVRALSDDSGTVLGRANYGPYGESLGTTLPAAANARFEGTDIDHGTGLQYAGARFYDRILNRYISPDTLIPDLLETQSPNRYAYNYDNPLSYVDPSGHAPIGIEQGLAGDDDPELDFGFSSLGLSSTSRPEISSTAPPVAQNAPGLLNKLPIGRMADFATGGHRDALYAAIDIGLDIWDHKLELGFGVTTGAMETLLPAGWMWQPAVSPDQLGLNFSPEQQDYYELARGGMLLVGGAAKTVEGVSTMAAAAPPTGLGALTVETGVGGVAMLAGLGIEASGAAITVDGAADAAVGLMAMQKGGIYVLLVKGVIRYVGMAANFGDRRSDHARNKPCHEFQVYWEIDDPEIRRGAEQYLMEQNWETIDWNLRRSIGLKNETFDAKVIDFIEWYENRYGPIQRANASFPPLPPLK